MANSDISLEPLFNQSSQGDGASRRIAFVPIDTVGVASHRTAITATSAAQEITISTGKRTIELQNTGTNVIYYGGSGVTSANGLKLFPNQVKPFSNVKDDFSIYLVCDGAETSEVRIVEYT